jgi:hypothetical protein
MPSTDCRCLTMRRASCTNTGMRQRRPGDPPIQGMFTFGAFYRKDMPQILFQQAGPT